MWTISVGSVSVSEFFFLSVTSVSSYQWIAFWIAFCVIFVSIVICRIVDCWLKCQSFPSFYLFWHNVWRNLPLIFNACILSLFIVCDRGLIEIIHSHIIGVMSGVVLFLFCFCHDFTDCLSKLLIGKCCIVMIIVVNESFQHLLKVFIFLGVHTRSFIHHVKSVQNILTIFEYVKIARHFICNWIFLTLCPILFAFLFFDIFVNGFWFFFLRRTFVKDDAFWFVLVCRTDLRYIFVNKELF